MVVAEAEALMTVEDFWAFVDLPENQGRSFELDEGILIEMPPSKPINSIIAIRVAIALGNFVYPRDLGYITGADGGYRVGPRKVRQPDVGYISKTRLPKIPAHFEIAPDLAVEIVSPDEDVLKKARDYLAAGTQAVWGVYSDEREVAVIRRAADGRLMVEILDIEGTLTCEDVLPGFALPVRDIFPPD